MTSAGCARSLRELVVLPLSAAIFSLVLLASSALAHDGQDHGSAASAIVEASPRAVATSEAYQLVAIAEGEVFGVIGPNSAGKTTLLRLLTRVVAADRGEVRVDGCPVGRLAHAELARQIAVVPQDTPRPFPFSVEQLVLMGRYPHAPGRFFESDADRAQAAAAMEATGVRHLAALPLEQLSGGERQRAMLARALAQQPRQGNFRALFV